MAWNIQVPPLSLFSLRTLRRSLIFLMSFSYFSFCSGKRTFLMEAVSEARNFLSLGRFSAQMRRVSAWLFLTIFLISTCCSSVKSNFLVSHLVIWRSRVPGSETFRWDGCFGCKRRSRSICWEGRIICAYTDKWRGGCADQSQKLPGQRIQLIIKEWYKVTRHLRPHTPRDGGFSDYFFISPRHKPERVKRTKNIQ